MLYEADIQKAILQDMHLFEDLGTHAVITEKGMMMNESRADMMIFSAHQGIIGIEIKTEADSTSRLKSQLKNYAIICDYVYILCHDKHVPKVEKVLQELQYDFVGVLSYLEYDGSMVVGKENEAIPSPYKSAYMAWMMIWKTDVDKVISKLLKGQLTFNRYGEEWSFHRDNESNYEQAMVNGTYMRKSDMISFLMNYLGDDLANHLLCRWMIVQDKDSEQIPLLTYRFYEDERENGRM